MQKKSIIIGNLPYNISSQILVKILRSKQWPSFISDIIFMFQKELGEKILGKFASKKLWTYINFNEFQTLRCK